MSSRVGARERLVSLFLGLALVASLVTLYSVKSPAQADHEPANKIAAAGTEAAVIGNNQTQKILEERVRVSTGADLILSVTLECSIITALKLGDDDTGTPASDTDSASGKVDVWVTIDEKVVKVSTDDTTDPGKVTFCNQLHQQRVTDSETQGPGDNPDGIDTHETYLATKNANSFNWLAINTGSTYDSAANGNNILDIVVWASLTDSGTATCTLGSKSCSEAIIGHRTLIVEPTNASVHEAI